MSCETIQELLLDTPLEELDAQHQEHVDGCAACSAFARSLAAVDVGLEALPAIPAPEPLVQRTLETVHSLDEPAPSVLGVLGSQMGRGALAIIELIILPFRKVSQLRGPSLALAFGAPALLAVFVGVSYFSLGAEVRSITATAGGPINGLPSVATPAEEAMDESGEYAFRGNRYGIEGPVDEDITVEELEEIEGEIQLGASAGFLPPSGSVRPNFHGELGGDFGGADGDGLDESNFGRPVGGRFDLGQQQGQATDRIDRGLELRQSVEGIEEGRSGYRGGQNAPHRGEFEQDDDERDRETTGQRVRAAEVTRQESDSIILADPEPSSISNILATDQNGRFQTLVAGRDAVQGLSFQEARGLWANSYIPGDPRWRLLARQLRDRGETLSGVGVSAIELAREAEHVTPRIAAPRQSALALSVQSDRAEVEGQTRVLMQVGLRAASSRGRRPTLRSVVVLDLRRALSEEEQAQVRGLLQAISRSRTGADRIGIMVAGPHGGWLVEPGPLRFGEVTVALRRAMAREGGTATDLDDALGTAIESVNQLSDSDSPLGSGLVWMVTPGVNDTRALEGAAHAGALAGVTTTTIGLSASSTDALENIAMAGHGRRWIADADPAQLVRSEIAAVSRVVARALRLNVKLAPGVRLVDVLGSRRLGAQSAQRARASERALDRQLASRLGIAADREQDDDGISILIPAFYADDTHTVLLDLVVDHAGPVADVSLRYKDLLRLDNTEANERLVLPRGNAQRGPAQRDVMRDWLAYETSVSLRRAAQLLSSNRAQALQQLRDARARIEGMGSALRLPRAQVRAQAAVCTRFAEALQAGADATLMADSLRYASRRMLFGDPLDGSH